MPLVSTVHVSCWFSFFQVNFYLAGRPLWRATWGRAPPVKSQRRSCTRAGGRRAWREGMRMKRSDTLPCSWRASEPTACLKSEYSLCVCVWLQSLSSGLLHISVHAGHHSLHLGDLAWDYNQLCKLNQRWKFFQSQAKQFLSSLSQSAPARLSIQL